MGYRTKEFLKYAILIIAISFCNCKNNKPKSNVQEKNKIQEPSISFKADYDFLREHTDIILLEDFQSDGKVAISAALQGRVMTTTANGWHGKSYGWINKKTFYFW